VKHTKKSYKDLSFSFMTLRQDYSKTPTGLGKLKYCSTSFGKEKTKQNKQIKLKTNLNVFLLSLVFNVFLEKKKKPQS